MGVMPKDVGLSRERIVEAALAFVDRDGLDALTVRGLAAELGVGAMTLYGYFRTKDELLDALADAAVEEIERPDLRGRWDARLRTCMVDLYRVLLRHPRVIPLLTSRPPQSPNVLAGMQLAIECLLEGGFDETEARRAYRSLLAYVFGSAGFAAQGRDGKSGSPRFGEDQFTYGLDTLLVGVRSARTKRRAPARASSLRRAR